MQHQTHQAQTQPAPVTPGQRRAAMAGTAGRAEKRRQQIRRGEIVSNAPLRARCEWLMNHDPEFSLVTVCRRMADQGYVTYLKRNGGRDSGDTTHLLRVLGMANGTTTRKKGRVYVPPCRTQYVPYELGVALAHALHMDPVDAGV